NAKSTPVSASSSRRLSMMRPASAATVSGRKAERPRAIVSALTNSDTSSASRRRWSCRRHLGRRGSRPSWKTGHSVAPPRSLQVLRIQRLQFLEHEPPVLADEAVVEPDFTAADFGVLAHDHVPVDVGLVAVARLVVAGARGEVDRAGDL